MIKPEIEDVKPFSLFSKSAQHSESLVVGHTPGMDHILVTPPEHHYPPRVDHHHYHGLTFLVIKESAGACLHQRLSYHYHYYNHDQYHCHPMV